MAFRVETSPEALNDLDEITTDIAAHSDFPIAENWFQSIFASIRTLCEMPHRCPLLEREPQDEGGIRLLLHGRRGRRYKIYFGIDENTQTVRIFHIRHWAMKPINADELDSFPRNV